MNNEPHLCRKAFGFRGRSGRLSVVDCRSSCIKRAQAAVSPPVQMNTDLSTAAQALFFSLALSTKPTPPPIHVAEVDPHVVFISHLDLNSNMPPPPRCFQRCRWPLQLLGLGGCTRAFLTQFLLFLLLPPSFFLPLRLPLLLPLRPLLPLSPRPKPFCASIPRGLKVQRRVVCSLREQRGGEYKKL